VASASRKRRSFFIPHAGGFNSIFDAYRNGTHRSRKDFEALFVNDFKAILKSAEILHDKRTLRIKKKQMRSTKSGTVVTPKNNKIIKINKKEKNEMKQKENNL